MTTSARFVPPSFHGPDLGQLQRCHRCKLDGSEPVALLHLEAVCRSCVLGGPSQKVRVQLAGGVAVGRKVALAYSGGAGSRLALDVLARIMKCGRKRRLFSDAVALIVDTTSAFVDGGTALRCNLGSAERQALLATALAEPLRNGLHTLVIPLEAAFARDDADGAAAANGAVWSLAPAVSPDGSDAAGRDDAVAAAVHDTIQRLDELAMAPGAVAARAALTALFESIDSVDAREDLLVSLQRRLLMEGAASAGCYGLITCECADTMSRLVLTNMCSGRGHSSPLDAARVDNRRFQPSAHTDIFTAPSWPTPPPCGWYPTLQSTPVPHTPLPRRGALFVLRPALELEGKEAALFSRLQGFPTVVFPSFVTMTLRGSSIGLASAALLTNLQGSFLNTVHNVVRTTQKLVPPGSAPPPPRPANEEVAVATAAAAAAAASASTGASTSTTIMYRGAVGTAADASAPGLLLCALCASVLRSHAEVPRTGVVAPVCPPLLCTSCSRTLAAAAKHSKATRGGAFRPAGGLIFVEKALAAHRSCCMSYLWCDAAGAAVP